MFSVRGINLGDMKLRGEGSLTSLICLDQIRRLLCNTIQRARKVSANLEWEDARVDNA